MATFGVYKPDSPTGRWWAEIKKAEQKSQGRIKAGQKSREWYRGSKEFFDKEFNGWKGELIRGNLWQRDYDILHDTLWADDPRFSITSEIEGMDAPIATVESMAEKVWAETDCFIEMETVFGAALHDNVAWAALEYEPHRQLPKIRWVSGYVAVDPLCKGIINRANWVAEQVERPLIDVITDETFPKEVRDKLLDNCITADKEEIKMDQTIKLAYVWTKRGKEPWNPKALTSRKLFVICDRMDDPLLEDEWPWPFIEADRFPLYRLQIKGIAGDLEGVNLWTLMESIFRQFNFLASFNFADVRRAITRKVLVDELKIGTQAERDKFESGQHLEMIKGRDIKDAVTVVDFADHSDFSLKSMQNVKQLHDEQSGITDVIRGEPSGGRQTAEEIRSNQNNAKIVFEGIAKVLSRFSDAVIRDFILAILYYVPAWSRYVDPSGRPMTFKKLMPLPDGSPDPRGRLIEVAVDPAELSGQAYVPVAGTIIRPGVDAYLGPERAYYWPEYSIDQLKRDFGFTVQTGSTRADAMLDEQRNTLAQLQQVGPLYQQLGLTQQLFELIARFIKSFRSKDAYKLLPPSTMVFQAQQMQQMMQAMDMAMKMVGNPQQMGAPAPQGQPQGQPQPPGAAGGPMPGPGGMPQSPMNMLGANPTQPFGAANGNGQQGPGSGFANSVAAGSPTAGS